MIKDDLSIWLNRKQVDLFVVSTGPELESIVGDDTTYGYTGKETRLTGLPRFDRLLRKAGEVEPRDRSLVLVAPTWRSWLTSSIDPETRAGDRQRASPSRATGSSGRPSCAPRGSPMRPRPG